MSHIRDKAAWTDDQLRNEIRLADGIIAGAVVAIKEGDYETAAGMLDHLSRVCAELVKRQTPISN